MKHSIILAFLLVLGLGGCKVFKKNDYPKGIGVSFSGYSYIPVDALPVTQKGGANCTFQNESPKNKDEQNEFIPLLESFPDQAVRMAIRSSDGSGNISYGPVSVGVKNNTYEVVLDYIIVDVARTYVYAKEIEEIIEYKRYTNKSETRYQLREKKIKRWIIRPEEELTELIIEENRKRLSTGSSDGLFSALEVKQEYGDLIPIPTYIGIGLRLTANVTVLNTEAELSSIGAIASEVEARNAVGRMTIQTLGITGKNVSSTLPIPSEINETTVQNALLAIGSVKALLHDSATIITPRVVGFYNNISGTSEVVNDLIAEVTKSNTGWNRPCYIVGNLSGAERGTP
ncbi:MAG: hypothetical protein AAF616_14125 [Bacteroidota bacterium]